MQAISSCELASCTLDELGCAPLPSHRIDGVALGDQHTCALTVAGTVRCWGDNASVNWAMGTPMTSASIETAASAADVERGRPRSCRSWPAHNHTCALLESGEVALLGTGE